jgi:eukaryotic-like serine/threonine-protein kinase
MSDSAPAAPGRTFGRFRVTRRLGVGGMGEVLLAHDELLGRDVAIKTLNVPGFEAAAGEEFRARFLNEARAIAALSHPNVVQVFDLGFEGETPYLVMEVVGGPSLRERLKEGRRLTFSEARALGIQLGGALAAAHARGVIHRDVKPANLLEAEPGVWKLADFGVARTPDSTLTAAGQFLGSPAYAAPEALVLGRFSPATDVFGLGATLYEGLCGETPFGDPRQAELESIVKGREAVAIGVRCPGIPADLARVVMQAIVHEASARPSATRLVEELAGAPPAEPPEPPGDVTRPGVPRALQATAAASASASVSVSGPQASGLESQASLAPPRTKRGWVIALAVAGGLVVVGAGVGLGAGAFMSSGEPPASQALGPQSDAGPPATRLRAPATTPAIPVPAVQVDAGAPVAPAVAVDAAPVAQHDAAPVARRDATPAVEREGAQKDQWQRVRRHLLNGRLEEAKRDLEDYVRRYPADKEGPTLLEYVKATQAGLKRGR